MALTCAANETATNSRQGSEMSTGLVADYLRMRGVSRRGFLKFCAATASLMAHAADDDSPIAGALENAGAPP